MKKEKTVSSGPTKCKTSQAPSSAPHIGILDRYSTEFFKN